MFSLGVIAWELFRPLQPDGSTQRLLDVVDRNPLTHQYKVQQLGQTPYDGVPPTLQHPLRMLLDANAVNRPQAEQFLRCPFFESGPVKMMRFLRALPEKDQGTQAQFLAQLPPHFEPFPARLLRDQVLPPLLLLAKNQALAPFVLPCLLQMAEKLEPAEFVAHLGKPLLPLINNSAHAQCTVTVLARLPMLMVKAAPDAEYKSKFLEPLLLRALDTPNSEQQNMALKQLVDVAPHLNYSALKAQVLPRVIQLTWKCPQLATRINCLMALAKTHQLFDTPAILETILPCLEQLAQKDKTPAILMCVLGCFQALGQREAVPVQTPSAITSNNPPTQQLGV